MALMPPQQHQHQHQPPSIWTQMSYTPPRGPCSQKTSIVSTCSCHRFMQHPLKAPTSFECDGCGHHASFHRMENREEEEVVRRWKGEAEDEEERGKEGERERGLVEAEMMGGLVVVGRKDKRRRGMIGGVEGEREREREREVVEVLDGEGVEEEVRVTAGRKRKGRG